MVAMLAHHRLVRHVHVIARSSVVAVEANPVHLALSTDFVFAHNGHVVLGLAGDETCRATRAPVQVNGHAPPVPRFRVVVRPELRIRVMVFVRGTGFGIGDELRQRRLLDLMAAARRRRGRWRAAFREKNIFESRPRHGDDRSSST